jgi:hypothetical protein
MRRYYGAVGDPVNSDAARDFTAEALRRREEGSLNGEGSYDQDNSRGLLFSPQRKREST